MAEYTVKTIPWEIKITAESKDEALNKFAFSEFDGDLNNYFVVTDEPTKFTCSKSKEEILEIVMKHFQMYNMQPGNYVNGEDRYAAMWELIHELEIYDNEKDKEK